MPPGRRVDHPLEGGVGVPVVDQPHVGEGILDLRPLEETVSPVNAVGDSGEHQRLFDHPGLGVGAVQHGHVVRAAAGFDDGLARAR